ncbi:MAG: tetratricopeptide repeat protein [Pontiella sp.]
MQTARALINRGSILGRLGKMNDAIADLSTLIDMQEAPTELIALAYNNRGFTHQLLGNSEEAIINFSAVIEFEHAPTNLIAQALVNRGFEYGTLGKVDKMIADYRAAMQFEDASAQVISYASYSLSRNAMLQGDWTTAFDLLQRVHVSTDERLRHWFSEDSTDLIHTIFESGQNAEAWRPKLDQFVKIYSNNGVLVELSTGLVASISWLEGCTISTDGLSAWGDLWKEYSKTYPELELGARLLKTGIAYLTSGKDITTLLELPKEERRLLAQALGLDSMDDEE